MNLNSEERGKRQLSENKNYMKFNSEELQKIKYKKLFAIFCFEYVR
jgi:hypothetical protein